MVPMFLLLALDRFYTYIVVSVVAFEQINVGWEASDH